MQSSPNELSKTYSHIAFRTGKQDVNSFISEIQVLGLAVEPRRFHVRGEASPIYFYGHDNHLSELYTGTLQEHLESYNSTT